MAVALKGLHHAGIPVRNLEASIDWYTRVLGLKLLVVDEVSGEDQGQVVGLPTATIAFALLSAGNAMVELLEYKEPRGQDFSLRNCDVGATHVAFEVEDVQAAYDALKEMDVNFSSEPMFDPEEEFVYFRDPDGIQLELYRRP